MVLENLLVLFLLYYLLDLDFQLILYYLLDLDFRYSQLDLLVLETL